LIAETVNLVAVLAGRGNQRRLIELARVEGLGPSGDYVLVSTASDSIEGDRS
jgi:type IV secretion system protein VirB11